MTDYQNDKYENFFFHLKVSRDGLAKFGDFTVEAVAADGVDALIAEQGAHLQKVVADFRNEVVTRKGRGGSSQTSTDAEQTAFEAFKAFINETDKTVLVGYFYHHADERDTFYPDKLAGLTQAPVTARLTRLTAYTEALEAAADKTVQAKGAPARTLLKAYVKASTTKTKSRTTLLQTIENLGPAATAVAEALWDVHTAACYAHRRDPQQARRYFDYASLPNRQRTPKAKAAPKTA
jgi:hypothetical protein